MKYETRSIPTGGGTVRAILQGSVGGAVFLGGAHVLRAAGFEYALLEALMAAACAGIVTACSSGRWG